MTLSFITQTSLVVRNMLQLLTALAGIHLALAQPLENGNDSIRKQAMNATEFSYQILISHYEESPKCGGVLISSGFLLTSASCVLEFGGIKTFMDEAILYGGGVSLLVDLGDVADAVIHPKYTVNPTAFDVALVKYIPDAKAPKISFAPLNGTIADEGFCIMTSWWNDSDSWPDRLNWLPVSTSQCEPPDASLLCFSDENTEFFKSDWGSPIVCDGVLTGLVPRGGGKKAINLSSDYDWITTAISELDKSSESEQPVDDNKQYFVQILEKLNNITGEQSSFSGFGDSFTQWNNQIVIPLSYVLFAMVIFFFVLLFFIILFTVVLVYYSKK